MGRGSRPRVRWHNDRVRKNTARLKRRAEAAAASRVAGETGAASLAGLRALVAHADEAGIDVRGRRALVLCTEGATDPVAYERIVGAPPPADVR